MEKREIAANRIAEIIRQHATRPNVNVWISGDKVRVYVDAGRGCSTRYGYVDIAADGTANADNARGCIKGLMADACETINAQAIEQTAAETRRDGELQMAKAYTSELLHRAADPLADADLDAMIADYDAGNTSAAQATAKKMMADCLTAANKQDVAVACRYAVALAMTRLSGTDYRLEPAKETSWVAFCQPLAGVIVATQGDSAGAPMDQQRAAHAALLAEMAQDRVALYRSNPRNV